MARIVVVGGGLGGLASSLRLAKLGHAVTLVEQSSGCGGVMGTVSKDGFTWDLGPTTTLLPAVLRDLFRKTGRAIEHEVDLVPVNAAQEHRFHDGSRVALPGGSRVDQISALDQLGGGLGSAWNSYVAAYAETWELLRRDFLERPYDESLSSPELRRLLSGNESLDSRIRGSLPDPRLRAIAALPMLLEGHELRRVPAWTGVEAYLHQRFGTWMVSGGFSVLAEALSKRLATRGVTSLTGTTVNDLVVRDGTVVGVATRHGELACDAVVCSINPVQLPALRPHVRRLRTTTSPTVCHIAVTGAAPTPGSEIVFHGDPLLVMRTREGTHDLSTISVLMRGQGDPLAILADRGIDLRSRLVSRLDGPIARGANSSAYGVEWRGAGTLRRRLGPTTPIKGVYAAGAYANPGAGVPWVGLSAALVAQSIGPAQT